MSEEKKSPKEKSVGEKYGCLIFFVFCVFGLYHCITSAKEEADNAPYSNGTDGLSTSTISNVKWETYDPGLKSRIDKLNDCQKLQDEFNVAEENSDNHLKNTGTNNAALMGYIDDKKTQLGCYKK